MTQPFRLCIVGNSHVAALKLGWDSIAGDWPGVEVCYFAKPADGLADMLARGSRITLRGRRGQTYLEKTFGYGALDVAEIDAFVCVGMMAGVHPLIQMQATHKLAAQSGPALQYVSDAACVAAIGDSFRASVLAHVLDVLRAAGATRGLVTLDPPVSASVLDDGNKAGPVYREVIARGEGPLLAGVLARAVARGLPEGFDYLPPPGHLTLAEVLTRAEYSAGSVRLRSGAAHGATDNRHMNADYGAEILRAALHRLGVEPALPERKGAAE